MLRRFLLSRKLTNSIAGDLKIYAYSVCSDYHLAEDLSQEVLAKVLESKRVPNNITELKPYAFRMLKNLYIDYIRKQNLRADYQTLQQQLFEKYSIDRCDMLNQYSINQAFNGLNEDQREILYLVDVLGYKYTEVADSLGLPIGTEMSRLSRARAKMLAFI